MIRTAGLLLALVAALIPASARTVTVAYAGSLVRTMEGPLAASLHGETGLRFSGEAKGSKALTNLILAGLRTPDVFISADPKLLERLLRKRIIPGYATFGGARMVIAYSSSSAHRALFEQAAHGTRSLLSVLAQPSLRIGRTDPQLDPKGARTLQAIQLLGWIERAPLLAQALVKKSLVFPEEDLAVRVESGELDAGFFYSTEVTGRGMRVVNLPKAADLSGAILYAVARLSQAPHPAAAARFMQFLLHGAGKADLERAGVRYLSRARLVGSP